MDSWYFAYGSNLLQKQMLERVGTIGPPANPPRIARLDHYRLVFQQLKGGGTAYANIQNGGDGVFGVIYRCREVDLEVLDTFERGYARRPVAVIEAGGEQLEAVAYVMTPDEVLGMGRPSEEYLMRIVTGATHHGLPEVYIKQIVEQARTAVF